MNDYNFKPFQQVLVRDYETSKWCAEIYSHYDNNEQKHRCIGGVRYDDCIPYEGNEALLGTTDAPKSKRWRAESGERYYVIYIACDGVHVWEKTESGKKENDYYYQNNNYFCTREEAQKMADKFKAMLKGGKK